MVDSIFGTDTPAAPDNNDTTTYTMGTYFTPDVDGTIDVRWYAPSGTIGSFNAAVLPIQVRLWKVSDGSLLQSGSFSSITAGAWNPAGVSWSVTASTQYCVSVTTDRYTATSHYFDTAKTVGHLTSPIAAGRFKDTGVTNATPTFPDQGFNNGAYFIDPLFTAGGGSGSDLAVSATLSGTGSPSGSITSARTAAGTLTGTGTPSGTAAALLLASGTLLGHGALSGTAEGGDVPDIEGAQYDLNDIMDALAATFDGTPTGETIGGSPVTLECHSEIVGSITPPSIVLELDGQGWDLNMGDGADSISIVALLMVTYNENEQSQRLLRSFLSRKSTSGLFRMKAALEANQALGGLISYAVITTTRNIGIVTYDGIDYLGAELVIEVMS